MKRFFVLLNLILFIYACGGTVKETRLYSPDALGRTRCVAVVPFENQTNKGMAGYQVAEILSSEVIASRAFGVMEPLEALRSMQKNKIPIPAKYEIGKAVDIGRSLGVDGIFVGTLKKFSFEGPFAELDEGAPVISFEVSLIDTSNGSILWSAKMEKKGGEVSGVSREYLISFARSSVKEALEPVLMELSPRDIPVPCWKPKAPVVASKPKKVAPPSQPSAPPAPPPAQPPTVAVQPVSPPAPKVAPSPPRQAPKPAVKSPPARIEVKNASGNPKAVDSVGMILLMNNHDLRKMTDQKTISDTTIIYYKPNFEAEAGRIMVELKKGKLMIKPDLPGDIDIQIIVGKDML